jgi:hypothetical protein
MKQNRPPVRIVILLFILIAPIVGRTDELTNELTKAVEQAQATKHYLDGLTTNDVPIKWRTTLVDKSTDNYAKKIFLRGTNAVLEVGWLKGLTGERTNFFHSTICNGPTRISMITGLRDSTAISPPDSKRYAITTFAKKDGKLSVEVTDSNGYYEIIEVCGKDTHPMDGLEYMRTVLGLRKMEHVTDILSSEIGKDRLENEKK